MKTEVFSVRDVLTVTTGLMLCAPKGERDNGIRNLYAVLGHMTGDSPSTHQIGRFAGECKPWLLRWFPELAKVEAFLPDLKTALAGAEAGGFGRMKTENVVKGWLIRVQVDCGLEETYEVPQIPADDHERKDPYDELVAELGSDEGVMIVET